MAKKTLALESNSYVVYGGELSIARKGGLAIG